VIIICRTLVRKIAMVDIKREKIITLDKVGEK